jgi:hypothetical protein
MGQARTAALVFLLVLPVAGALPPMAEVLQGSGTFGAIELGRSFATCPAHPNAFDPLPGDLRVVLAQAPSAGVWLLSFTFTHVDPGDALATCVVHEDCRLLGDPTLGGVDALCAKDVLPSGRVALTPNGDGTSAFSAFLGFELPFGGGADLTQGEVAPA